MSTFVINPHGRLHEWIAHEKGYFEQAGLNDYKLNAHSLLTKDATKQTVGKGETLDNKQGAYQTYEEGRDASISCACHWTVNMAAAASHGNLWGECYSVSPCAIMVPESSSITSAEHLAGVDIHVGYQSGSHYTTIQVLEPILPKDNIKLIFGGTPADRIDQALDGVAPAVTVFGPQLYMLEQLGFRKIIDCTFMIAAMIPEGVLTSQIQAYYTALRMAQADIDQHHQVHVHYYKNELPERHAELVDVRRFGPGERIVFEPYTKAMYERTQSWVQERGIFDTHIETPLSYDNAVMRAG